MIPIPPDLQSAMAEFCDMVSSHMDKYPLAGTRSYDPAHIKNMRNLADEWNSAPYVERASLRSGKSNISLPHRP